MSERLPTKIVKKLLLMKHRKLDFSFYALSTWHSVSYTADAQ